MQLCKEYQAEPLPCILNQIKSAQQGSVKKGYSLDLSTHSLDVKTCVVLGKLFSTDRAFNRISLNDCMVPEEGVNAFANGLRSNVACKRLDLKGNNIRGSAAESFGHCLKENKSLLSVCLEWNALGMLETAFSIFCEGLSHNVTLQVLDLRNNQISHDGATQLAAALKNNQRLKSLDLRWNNVGLIGGRAILNALRSNKTIVKLDLAGNNVPNDVMKAIEAAVASNADYSSLNDEFSSRTRMLSKEIQQGKKDRKAEVSDLLDKLDRADSMMNSSNRSYMQRINQLSQALEDRKAQFNNIVAKMSLTESELALSETKVNELSLMLSQAQEDQANLIQMHQTQLKQERESKAVMEGKMRKELMDSTDKMMQLENKIDELERKCASQQEQMYEYKEHLTHNQADIKMKTSHFDERIRLEKQKTKEAYNEAEEMKHREIERIKKEMDAQEASFKERITKLEERRIELEEEISRMKTASSAEKVQMDEQVFQTKARLKEEEEHRINQLEEKIRLLKSSKDELQSHSHSQSNHMTEMQTKISSLTLENETLKHKCEDMTHELAGKNNDIIAEVTKVRLELNQRIQRLESEKQSKQDLYDKIEKYEKDQSDLNNKLLMTTQTKESEIKLLTEQLRAREAEISAMKEEDAQRATMLQTAIQSYVTRTPYQSPRK